MHCNQSHAENYDVPISIKVEGNLLRGTEPIVRTKVTNESKAPIILFKSALPSRYGIILVAVQPAKHGQALENIYLTDDPGSEKVTIPPGQSVEGELLLAHFFKDISSVLSDQDLLLFWSYRLKTIDNRSSKRLGGWFELSKLTKTGNI